jgi:trehalose synthase
MTGALRSTGDGLLPRPVEVKRRMLESYRSIVGDDAVAEIRDLGYGLRGLRVLHLSSTAMGGGVAELLASVVPLERDVGLAAEWHLIAGDARFFGTTKRIHNGLQGMPVTLSERDRRDYLEHNEAAARKMADDWDVVVVHDPQPAAVRSFAPESSARWLWRCHVDSSHPDPSVWAFLRPFVERHDRVAFTLTDFVPPDLQVSASVLVPAIDPLTSKNRVLPEYLARETVAEFGIDVARPLMLQVSRFDPWKNPLGVVAAWRLARETFPELQLALVGSMAADDPEGWEIYRQVQEEARDERDCFLFTNQLGVAHHEVNAFQRVADVAVQMSTREGFGLVVSETLWKGTPMVAGSAGGIPLQLEHGVSGLIADGAEQVATAVVAMLEDPDRSAAFGLAGHAAVRERFLTPRLLRDEIELLGALSTGFTR